MPRKDPDEYREYMRNYMRKKKAGENTKMQSNTPPQPKSIEQSDMNTFTDGLKELLGEDLIQDDPILKGIEKYSPYINLGLKFVQGFAGRMQEAQANQANAAPQVEEYIPQKPEGYKTIAALKYKDDPDYQRQVQEYEMYLKSGKPLQKGVSAGVNTNSTAGFKSGMSQNEILRLQEENLRLRNQMLNNQPPEPKGLASLENKYPEPPMAQQSEIKEPIPVQPVENTQPKPETIEAEEIIREDTQIKMIQAEIQEKLQAVVTYLNSQSLEDFKVLVDNFEKNEKKELAKVKMAKMFLSAAIQNAIKNTTPEELEELLKINCKDKYDYLVKEEKVQKYKDIFEKIRSMF